MPRIAPVPLDDLDETIRARLRDGMTSGVYDNDTGEPPLSMRILGWSSYAFGATDAVMRRLWEPSLIDPRLRELLRIRSAQLNGCMSCSAYVKGSEVSSDDAQYMTGIDMSGFDPRERAAIAFCTKFAEDHYAIDDADFKKLLEHFSPAETVELALFVSVMSGLHRFMSLCQVNNDRAPLIDYRPELLNAPQAARVAA